MPRSQRSLSQLPALEDTWLVGASRLRTWVKEGDSPPRRPYLILIASSNMGLVCGNNIVPEPPSATQVADVLFKAMQHPPRELGKASRPRSIALADAALLEPLQTLLRDKGVETEIPAMLDAPKVTLELLKGVFEAAAEFYRAAPLIRLSNEQVIAVRHPNEHNYHYALVMGQGGVEYGLVRYGFTRR